MTEASWRKEAVDAVEMEAEDVVMKASYLPAMVAASDRAKQDHLH